MVARLMLVLVLALAVTGCVTTPAKQTPINQLQNQVVDLEQRMEQQEKEIVDLKYEVKDVAGKIDAQNTVEVETSKTAPEPTKASTKSGDSDLSLAVIKVAVSPSEVQKALKGAGLYEGKIDGKIGQKTKAAIVEFQKQHGLKADGVIGQKTWAEMKTYLAE